MPKKFALLFTKVTVLSSPAEKVGFVPAHGALFSNVARYDVSLECSSSLKEVLL